MLRRFARCAAGDERKVIFDSAFGENFLGMRIKPRTITPRDVQKQQFRREGERRYIRSAKLFDAVLQQSANRTIC